MSLLCACSVCAHTTPCTPPSRRRSRAARLASAKKGFFDSRRSWLRKNRAITKGKKPSRPGGTRRKHRRRRHHHPHHRKREEKAAKADSFCSIGNDPRTSSPKKGWTTVDST